MTASWLYQAAGIRGYRHAGVAAGSVSLLSGVSSFAETMGTDILDSPQRHRGHREGDPSKKDSRRKMRDRESRGLPGFVFWNSVLLRDLCVSVVSQNRYRQMKRSTPFTAPALLAGLWSLLTMLESLEHHHLDDLKQPVRDVQLPFPILKGG